MVEEELISWTDFIRTNLSYQNHPLNHIISKPNLEMNTYWLFKSIMVQIEVLYAPGNGVENVPPIVPFCTLIYGILEVINNNNVTYNSFCLFISDDFLCKCDSELAGCLKAFEIHPQLYGMRWARLLLGREFPLTSQQSLRIWDYLFACCLSERALEREHVIEQRNELKSALLVALAEFMVAMIRHVRY